MKNKKLNNWIHNSTKIFKKIKKIVEEEYEGCSIKLIVGINKDRLIIKTPEWTEQAWMNKLYKIGYKKLEEIIRAKLEKFKKTS